MGYFRKTQLLFLFAHFCASVSLRQLRWPTSDSQGMCQVATCAPTKPSMGGIDCIVWYLGKTQLLLLFTLFFALPSASVAYILLAGDVRSRHVRFRKKPPTGELFTHVTVGYFRENAIISASYAFFASVSFRRPPLLRARRRAHHFRGGNCVLYVELWMFCI